MIAASVSPKLAELRARTTRDIFTLTTRELDQALEMEPERAESAYLRAELMYALLAAAPEHDKIALREKLDRLRLSLCERKTAANCTLTTCCG